ATVLVTFARTVATAATRRRGRRLRRLRRRGRRTLDGRLLATLAALVHARHDRHAPGILGTALAALGLVGAACPRVFRFVRCGVGRLGAGVRRGVGRNVDFGFRRLRRLGRRRVGRRFRSRGLRSRLLGLRIGLRAGFLLGLRARIFLAPALVLLALGFLALAQLLRFAQLALRALALAGGRFVVGQRAALDVGPARAHFDVDGLGRGAATAAAAGGYLELADLAATQGDLARARVLVGGIRPAL